MVNKNVPYFEEEYGKHDYLWLLETTKRRCKEIEPCVVRYVNGKNLSLDPVYRAEDFCLVCISLLQDRNYSGIKRLCASRAKYFYKMGDYKRARAYLHDSERTLKNIAYYITSYLPPLARWVVRKYNVFG